MTDKDYADIIGHVLLLAKQAAAYVDMPKTSPRIIAAAYCKDDIVYSLPRPYRHCHILWAYGNMDSEYSGFLTDKGNFVDRKQAYTIAENAQQLLPDTRLIKGTLYSENVW